MSGLLAKLEHDELMKMDWPDLQRIGKNLNCPPLYISNQVFKERLRMHIQLSLEQSLKYRGDKDNDLWTAKDEMKDEDTSESLINKEHKSKKIVPLAAKEKVSSTVSFNTKPPSSKAKTAAWKGKNKFPPPKPGSSKAKKSRAKNAERKNSKRGILSSIKSRPNAQIPNAESNKPKFCTPFCGGGSAAAANEIAENKEVLVSDEAVGMKERLSGPSSLIRGRSRQISKRIPDYKSHKIHPLKMEIEKPSIADFDLLKEIGAGAFGKVYQVKHIKSGKIYAMKVLKKKKIVERNQVEHTRTERQVLKLSRHPFCVTLRCAFQTRTKLYFVMDFYRGGELFFHLQRQQRFKEDTVRLMVAEVTLALGHLHKNDIIYRDLKPENILIDQEGHVALTDFGMTKRLKKGENTKTFCGTPEYLAPEVVKGLAYDKNVDWWSVGILCYELSVGIPPFYSAQSLNEMYRKIQYAKLSWRRRQKYLSKELMDFVAQLLDRNPKTRLGTGFEDGDEVVSHEFFSSLDLDAVLDKSIKPKYYPKFKDAAVEDTSNFEAVKKVQETYEKKNLMPTSSINPFEGFTYKPDAYLGGGV